jgi:orotidine-5'-phosphate decarboxylase
MNFIDRLIEQVDRKQSHVCVGLDPRLNRIPADIKCKAIKQYGKSLEAVGRSFVEFNRGIIDATKDYVVAVKPQIAFYEQYGHIGIKAFEETVAYAKEKELLVISDAKRNDIGSTAQAYADSYLGTPQFWDGHRLRIKSDSLTVTPYLGSDGIKPFVDNCQNNNRGIFILVKTSNPSSGEVQDLATQGNEKLYERMAKLVDKWGAKLIGEKGYSSVGAVVAATYPQEAKLLRKIMANNYFLVPGYGTQGGKADDVVSCFNDDGYGAIVNSSRGIIFAHQQAEYSTNYQQAARSAVIKMRNDLNYSLKEANKLAW